MDENYRIGETVADQTIIHPIALGFTLLMGVLILFLPRKYTFIPFLVAIFIPIQQRLVIATLDFFMLRILVLFGWARIVMRSEYWSFKLNTIDKAMIWWAIVRTISYTMLWQTSSAFFNRLGLAFDALGIYFLFKFLIQDIDDIKRIIKILIIVSIFVAISMLIERMTGRNAFYIFGGVPEFTAIRDGRLRCQGAFMHPILSGSFGAAIMPLFISIWKTEEQGKTFAILGCLAATTITMLSSSSGPILAYFVGLGAIALWNFRLEMRIIQWLVVCGLLVLQMFMSAPVWAIFIHIAVFGSSTGWHRYFLIDEFIKRFDEWWLFGTRYTAQWGGWLYDVTNQYIRIAVDGGIITLFLFLLIILLCFRSVGRTLRILEEQSLDQMVVWGFGVSLFVHVASFVSVSYFDQIIIVWYLTTAIISNFSSLFYKIDDDSNISSTN